MNTEQITADTYLDIEEYNGEQIKEALGPVNKYFTSKKLGRNPTNEEAFHYWMTHGGPENFAKQHRSKFFKEK